MQNENKTIPKVINYCWFGNGKLGEKEERCINTWKQIMPNYEIIRWDESNYDIKKNKFIEDAYNAKKWAFVSDYARLDIIYNNGGIYLDTDVEVLKPFDDLLDNDCFMGFEDAKFISTGIGFGAIKGNAFVKKNMDKYDELGFDINNLNNISCPKVTSILLEESGATLDGSTQKRDNFTLYSKDYFCPMDYATGEMSITDNTHSIHHYSMTWLSDRDKKWHNFQLKTSQFLGNKLAHALMLICKLPGSIIESFKKIGFRDTVKLYCGKFRRVK